MPSYHQFRHFINYHNPDAMGFEFDEVEGFACVTKKISDLVGNRVWLVGRRGDARDCYLYGTFKIATVEQGDFGGFVTRISGVSGQLFDPAVRLDDLPWFPSLKMAMANFSLGFQRLKSGPALEGLQSIRASAG